MSYLLKAVACVLTRRLSPVDPKDIRIMLHPTGEPCCDFPDSLISIVTQDPRKVHELARAGPSLVGFRTSHRMGQRLDAERSDICAR